MSKPETSNLITLRGSTEIVTEFFNCAVNSVLYQRAIYAPESFKRVTKYGLSMMMTTDEAVLAYLANISRQLEGKLPLKFALEGI
jgi:mitotic spindle assembly checkpoint protein MAD2